MLHTSHWSVIEKADAVKTVTLEDLKTFSKRLKDTFRLDCLVQGNYSKDQALEVARMFKKGLQSCEEPTEPLAPVRICQVPLGNKICRLASFHPTDANSVVVNYYQIGPTNMRQTAVMEILVVIGKIFLFGKDLIIIKLFYIIEPNGGTSFRCPTNPRAAGI